MTEEAGILTTRVTSAFPLQNTVTALMGTSLLEKDTACNSGAGTAGAMEEEEEAMLACTRYVYTAESAVLSVRERTAFELSTCRAYSHTLDKIDRSCK